MKLIHYLFACMAALTMQLEAGHTGKRSENPNPTRNILGLEAKTQKILTQNDLEKIDIFFAEIKTIFDIKKDESDPKLFHVEFKEIGPATIQKLLNSGFSILQTFDEQSSNEEGYQIFQVAFSHAEQDEIHQGLLRQLYTFLLENKNQTKNIKNLDLLIIILGQILSHTDEQDYSFELHLPKTGKPWVLNIIAELIFHRNNTSFEKNKHIYTSHLIDFTSRKKNPLTQETINHILYCTKGDHAHTLSPLCIYALQNPGKHSTLLKIFTSITAATQSSHEQPDIKPQPTTNKTTEEKIKNTSKLTQILYNESPKCFEALTFYTAQEPEDLEFFEAACMQIFTHDYNTISMTSTLLSRLLRSEQISPSNILESLKRCAFRNKKIGEFAIKRTEKVIEQIKIKDAIDKLQQGVSTYLSQEKTIKSLIQQLEERAIAFIEQETENLSAIKGGIGQNINELPLFQAMQQKKQELSTKLRAMESQKAQIIATLVQQRAAFLKEKMTLEKAIAIERNIKKSGNEAALEKIQSIIEAIISEEETQQN